MANNRIGRELLVISVQANEAITKGRVVTVDGYQYDGTSPSDDQPIGVALLDCDSGDYIDIVVSGTVMCEVGATTVVAGNNVMAEKVVGGAGKVIPYTAAAGNYIIGQALEGATGGSGDLIEVNLQPPALT